MGVARGLLAVALVGVAACHGVHPDGGRERRLGEMTTNLYCGGRSVSLYFTSYEFKVTAQHFPDGRLDFRLDRDIHVPWCSGTKLSPLADGPQLQLIHSPPCLSELLNRYALTGLQIDASAGARSHTERPPSRAL
jgi:hypothetical protein